jgi:hypothetical protein
MQMINSEIVRSYKEAKDKAKQITILADLNACTEEQIKIVLKAAGIDGRSWAGRQNGAKNSRQKKETAPAAMDWRQHLKEIRTYIRLQEEKKKQLQEQMACIDNEIQEIRAAMSE